jgi:hypothetical protein
VAAEWDWRLSEVPSLATQAGDHRIDDRLERLDAARLVRWRGALQALQASDRVRLPAHRQADIAVFANQVDTLLGELEHGGVWMPMDSDQAFLSYCPTCGASSRCTAPRSCRPT